MKPGLVKQAHDIRMQAAALLERAERLLEELRQIADINISSPSQESLKNGRTLHIAQRF